MTRLITALILLLAVLLIGCNDNGGMSKNQRATVEAVATNEAATAIALMQFPALKPTNQP